MPPDPRLDDGSDYSSAEDSDFAPETAPLVASDDSSGAESDDENLVDRSIDRPKTVTSKRKRAKGTVAEEAEDVGFENSGDEEIVERGLKRQRKKGKKSREDEDDGGEGGFVRTRRMAALATEEKKPLANTAAATVDVDALWASMMSGTTKVTAELIRQESTLTEATNAQTKARQLTEKEHPGSHTRIQSNSPGRPVAEDATGEDVIMIQRTYNFAGKVHVEEKMVARDSAEARLWQESQSSGKKLNQPIPPNKTALLRPPKLARRSIFEPITEPLPQRTDLRFGVGAAGRDRNTAGANSFGAAKKLNTVEKSKMDWAGFVDKEGIKDDLETAGKSKGAYLDQKEFLARVEEKREEEARRARLKV